MSTSQCRICLQYVNCSFKLDDKVKEQFIWEALNSIAKVSVAAGDSFPQFVCWTCFDKLDQAIEFQQEVEKSDKVLHSNDIECVNFVKVEDVSVNGGLENEELDPKCNNIYEPIVTIKSRSGRVIKQKKNIYVEEEEAEVTSVKDEIKSEKPEVTVDYSVKTAQNKKVRIRYRKIKGHRCCMCLTTFDTEPELTSHVFLTHASIIEENVNKKYTTKHLRECKICKQKFRLHRSIRRHMVDVNYKEPPRNRSKEYEKRKEKPKKKTSGRDHQQMICAVCAKVMSNKHELVQHELRMHAKDLKFKCTHPTCEKRFAIERMMKKHRKCHGDRNYTCNVCGKAFLAEKHLLAHSFIHEEVKMYQCAHCPRSFTYRNILRRHVEGHFQEKIFRCDLCPKTYKWEPDLKRHVQGVHIGDLPFKCKFCNKGYFARSSRKYHEQRCELYKPF